MKKQQLSLGELTKGLFVLIEIYPEIFEIGIVNVDGTDKQICTLTASTFTELPITFDSDCLPFFPQGMLHLNPLDYACYVIDQSFVENLLTRQLLYLQGMHNFFNKKIEEQLKIMEGTELQRQSSIIRFKKAQEANDAMLMLTEEIIVYIQKNQK